MKQSANGFGAIGIIGLIAVLGIGAVVITQNTGSNDVSRENSPVSIVEEAQETVDGATKAMEEATMDDSMMKDDETEVMADETMVKAETAVETVPTPAVEEMIKTEETVATPGSFEAYSPEKLALAADSDVVLFFHASWCPSCRALESDINASLSDIPANTHILKVDYDTATALKQEYGVVRQHTLVTVDANGAKIKTLTGLTNTLEQVIAQI